ncbi:MAG TPA: M23 family metallopeptidase [Caulobacteraceae bacterium]|nr:M23 family metallopeptidase [Caulobacteraceae bacterium]
MPDDKPHLADHAGAAPPSFDPRTWREDSTPAGPATFDPKSWARPRPQASAAAPRDARRGGARGGRPPRRLFIAAGGATLVAAAAGSWLALGREGRRRAAPAPATGAATAPATATPALPVQAAPIAAASSPGLCASPIGQIGEGETFHSAAAAVLHDDALIFDFAQAMAYDFNFGHDLTGGTRFQAVVEQLAGPDERLAGRLVSAWLSVPAFTYLGDTASADRAVPAKSRRLYRFRPPGESVAGWFDETGRSAVRSLMRTPLDALKVTSTFGLRMHPLDNVEKEHKGVDFACRPGTSVYAAASGVVARADVAAGYGNLLVLTHEAGMETRYAHLQSFAPGVVVGAHVVQGQLVALSGDTGRVTGPHLHYEIRKNGAPQDPLTYVAAQSSVLSGSASQAFRAELHRIDGGTTACI